MNDTGIGLGLTIVKQIVEQSQGSVHAKSPGIGKGSTFSFNMVIETAEQAESRESSNYSRKNGDIANHLQENLPAIDFDKESRKSQESVDAKFSLLSLDNSLLEDKIKDLSPTIKRDTITSLKGNYTPDKSVSMNDDSAAKPLHNFYGTVAPNEFDDQLID